MTVAAFVLGAGSASRFASGHKLVADFRGRPLVSWSVAAATDAGFGRVHLVWGAIELAAFVPEHVEVVHNPSWRGGLATSLAVAVEVARAERYDAIVVGLADQPLVPSAAWRQVSTAAAPIGVATYGGRRRTPVRFDASVWDLLPTRGDEGARAVIAQHEDLVEEIPCPGDPVDIDTLEDLARWS